MIIHHTYVLERIFNFVISPSHSPLLQGDPGLRRRWWHLIVALLMMTFQIMLCLRLQTEGPKLYYVFIPFWFVLVVFSADVLITLIVNTRTRSR